MNSYKPKTMSDKHILPGLIDAYLYACCLLFVLASAELKAQPENGEPTASASSSMAKSYNRLDYFSASLNLGKKDLSARKYEKAELHFQHALDVLDENDDTDKTLDALNLLAESQIRQRDREKAEPNLRRALELGIATNDTARLLRTRTIIATKFFFQEQMGDALNAYLKALALAEQLDDKDRRAYLFYRIARCYGELDQHHEALENYKSAFELHTELDETYRSVKDLDHITSSQRQLGQFDEALTAANKALELLNSLDEPEFTAKILIKISGIHRMLSQYEAALYYASEALKIREQYTDYNATALALNQTGLIYSRLQQYDNAKFFYKKTLSLPQEHVSDENTAATLRDIASIYVNEGKYTEALDNAKRALELYNHDNNRQGKSTVHRLLGRIYIAQEQITLAHSEFKQALAHSNATGDIWGEAKALRYIGDIERASNIDSAIEKYKQSLSKAEQISAYDIQLGLYNALASSEYRKNNFKAAYQYLKQEKELSTKVNSIATNKAAARMKVEQETKEKEKEILELKRQSTIDDLELTRKTTDLEIARKNEKISSLEIERSKYIWLLMFIIFISATFSAIFLYYRYKLVEKNKNILDGKNSTLEELNENKDRLFSIIAHDLRSPIGAITSLSALLENDFDAMPDELKRSYIQELHTCAKNTHCLLEDMLEWAVAQLRSTAPLPKRHKLREMCFATTQTLRALATEKHITITCKIKDNIDVYADINMVSSVIRNILSNAIKFTPTQGEISFDANRLHNEVQLIITDNGVGMSAETIEHLFSYDKSLSVSGTNGERGFGVGLSLSREIIEKNGGKIHVVSEPNQGSTFYISLPSVPKI